MLRISTGEFCREPAEMNQQKITEYYPWSDNASINTSSKFTLCLDRCSTSGEFSFLYMLLKYIKSGVPVKLVCCNYSPNHYISILRKNNVNAAQLQVTGQLEILCVSEEPTTNANTSTQPSVYSWKQLVDWQNQFQDSCAGVALLVDDLDALEVLAPTPSAARRFMARSIELLSPTESHAGLHQLVTFGRHPLESVVELGGLDSSSGASVALAAAAVGNGAAAGNGLGLLNGRMPLSEVDQEPALCEYLRYRADVTVTVSALATGYSSAVHGVVAVSVREQAPRRQTLQYKALDSGVMCTLVGLSTF